MHAGMWKKITSIVCALVALLVSNNLAAKDAKVLAFKEAEELALKNSHAVAAQMNMFESASETASAQKVKRLPTLSLDASTTFQSKIGKINIPTIGDRDIGTHTNWSVGPTLNFVLFDAGQILKKAKSLKELASSENENLEYVRRQALLNVRSAYIGVQLAKEQVHLVQDALKLANAQYAYMLDRKKTGTADLLDLTVAHQEVVDREKDLENATGELSVDKRALVAALGEDANVPSAEEIDVEPLHNVLATLSPKSNIEVDVLIHPQVKSLEHQKLSSEFAGKSIMAEHWPQVGLQGRATYQYPNLGQTETVQQNTLTMGLSLPIVDFGEINKQSRSQRYKAKAALEEKEQTIIDLSKDTAEIRDRIGTLKKLQIADKKSVIDADEVARLSFSSFKIGRVIFLDVQRANVKALSAKVDSARTDAQLAAQIAELLALAEESPK